MIEIDGVAVRLSLIVSANVETNYYMNGSETFLVIKLADGSTMRSKHGPGFNVWDTYDRIMKS